MKDEKKFWKKLGIWLAVLMIVFGVSAIVASRIDQNFSKIYEQQKTENEAWLILEQTDDKTVKAIYDFFLTETTTFEEKLVIFEGLTVNDSSWESFFTIYGSHKYWLKSILDGITSPQEFVEAISSPMKLYLYLQWSFLALVIICGVGMVVCLLLFDAIKQEETKK